MLKSVAFLPDKLRKLLKLQAKPSTKVLSGVRRCNPIGETTSPKLSCKPRCVMPRAGRKLPVARVMPGAPARSARALVFVSLVAGLAVSLQRLILRHIILLMLPSGRPPCGAVALLQSISLRSIVPAAPCVVFVGGRRALFLVFVPQPTENMSGIFWKKIPPIPVTAMVPRLGGEARIGPGKTCFRGWAA